MIKDQNKRIDKLEEDVKDIKFGLLVARLVITVALVVMLAIQWGYL